MKRTVALLTALLLLIAIPCALASEVAAQPLPELPAYEAGEDVYTVTKVEYDFTGAEEWMVTLTLEGETPLLYFSDPSNIASYVVVYPVEAYLQSQEEIAGFIRKTATSATLEYAFTPGSAPTAIVLAPEDGGEDTYILLPVADGKGSFSLQEAAE